MRFDDEDDDDIEREPEELPEVVPDQPGPCCTCGKPNCTNGCFKCGKPVCYNEQDYLSDTQCGSWILDSWHPSAPHENEYWCKSCLKVGLEEEGEDNSSSLDVALVFSGSGGSFFDEDDDEDLGELEDAHPF